MLKKKLFLLDFEHYTTLKLLQNTKERKRVRQNIRRDTLFDENTKNLNPLLYYYTTLLLQYMLFLSFKKNPFV